MLELSLKEKDKYYAESLITPRFFLKKSPRHHEMSEDERLAYTMQRIINYIDQFQKLKSIDISSNHLVLQPDPVMVKCLFETFGLNLSMVPVVHRSTIFSLCQIQRYSVLQCIVDQNQKTTDIFLVCQGTAFEIKTQGQLKKIMKKRLVIEKETNLKTLLAESKNFTSLAKIGQILTKYIMQNTKIMSRI